MLRKFIVVLLLAAGSGSATAADFNKPGCPFVVSLGDVVLSKNSDSSSPSRTNPGTNQHWYSANWTQENVSWSLVCSNESAPYFNKPLHKERCFFTLAPKMQELCASSERWDGSEYMQLKVDGPQDADWIQLWYWAMVTDQGFMFIKAWNKQWRSGSSQDVRNAIAEMKSIVDTIRVRE